MRTFNSFVIDESGSMSDRWDAVIDGFNEYINGLKADTANEHIVALSLFDLTHGEPLVRVIYSGIPVKDVPPLTRETYKPRGSTPLYDAIGIAMRNIETQATFGDAIVIATMTDGAENASVEFKKADIIALKERREKEGWVFLALVTGYDAMQEAEGLGYARGNTFTFAGGRGSTMSAMRSASQGTVAYAAAAAAGKVGTQSFYADAGLDNEADDDAGE